MNLFLLLSLLLATQRAYGQSSVCEICGSGLVITNDDNQVVIPGQANAPTCAELQIAGLEGQISNGLCVLIPFLVFDLCGCVVAGAAPTEVPIGTETELPAADNPPCEICGAGQRVTLFDVTVNIPGVEITPTCAEFEQGGLDGIVSASQCPLALLLVAALCGCAPAAQDPSTSPPVVPPTPVPLPPPYPPPSVVPEAPTLDAINPPCEICGEGLKVTLFDVTVNIPGVEITPTCAEFEQGGLDGMVPASQCPLAPLLVSSLCECAAAPPPTTPIVPPSPSPTSAQETAKPTSENGCYVCGDAFSKITNFDALVDITGETITCAKLEQMALDGRIPANQCAFVPLLVSQDCGCESGSSSTPAPTQLPTVDPDICYVCGERFIVGQTSATLQLPGETLTCGDLEDRGLAGGLAQGDCVLIPETINATCDCIVDPDFQFEFTNPVCNVCGEGMMVTAPDATINFAGPSVSCAELSLRGFNGEVAESDCDVYPDLIVDICGCMEDSNPDSEKTQSPMMPSPTGPFEPTSDTVPSQTPATPPVRTTTPSSPAPTSETSGGCTSGAALFGSNTGTANQVEFLYEAITTPQTVSSALRGILTTTFEPAVSASLVSGIFGGLCSRRLQARRRLEVLGLSTQPNDELQSGVQCVTWKSNLNRCTVVKGMLTLYSEPNTDISDKSQAAIDRIQTSMGNGAFNGLDSRLVAVNFRSEPLPEEGSTPDPANAPLISAPAGPATVPVWAWIVIGVGISMLNACICFFVYRRRRMAAKDGSEGDDNGYGYGGDDGGYGGGTDYQDQPGGSYQDQPDGGYQGADDDDHPYDQPEAHQSTGFSQASSGQGSSSKAGGSVNRHGQSSFGDPNMMNSIGNL